MEAAAPKNINKYEVLGLIGRGGMGVVYKAIDRSLNRLVAIKMVTNTDDQTGESLKRFYREAQFTANLRHNNIVTVYELGEYQSSPYLVMEYLAGQSLDSMLARQPMTMLQKLAYVRQICNGLQYAHTRKPAIVHRDIKPANIVVVEDGTVKIVDFGIARMGHSRNTRSGQLMGSYHYMSPEQIIDMELDGRTDIFSTGVVLYQLLTLTLPFEGSGIAQTLHRIVHSPYPPLDQFLKEYPSELDNVMARALAKEVSDRYPTASDFAYDLAEIEERLRGELFGERLQQAESLLQSGEFEQARNCLEEVLRSDSQHTRANDLLRQVQQAEARRVRKQRARELRARAERELEQKSLTDALNSLDEAVRLDNSDTELQSYRQHVLDLHRKAEKLDNALARAERACGKNDFDAAASAVEEALQIDPASARAQSFKAIIEAKMADQETKRQVADLVTQARTHIAAREFSEALGVLHRAQVLNPSVHGLQDLLRAAEIGYQQQLRKQALDKSILEISEALKRGEPSLARNLSLAALQSYPDDASLVELNSAAERQLKARKRERALGAIHALLSAGQVEAAERQFNDLRSEIGDSVELSAIQEEIRAEQARIAEEEIQSAINEAQDLMRFGMGSQAVTTLDAVSERLRFASAEMRERYTQLHEQVQKLLQSGEGSAAAAGEAASSATWVGNTLPLGDSAPTVPPSGANLDRGSTEAARMRKAQERIVAELTPAEGLVSHASRETGPVADASMSMRQASESSSISADASSASAIRATPAWPEAMLKKVEESLARHIGPLATVVVKKAACRTNDPDELYRMLAQRISDPADRQSFLAHKVPLGRGQASVASQSSSSGSHAELPESAESISPAHIQRGAKLLTPYCGPVAIVLAKRAAQRAKDLRAFFLILSEHIENDSDRERFLRDAA